MNRTKIDTRNGRRPGLTPSRPPAPSTAAALPPHNTETEACALACILTAGANGSQAEVDALLEQLRPKLFYDLKHRGMFEACQKLRTESHAVDVFTLYDALKRQPEGSPVELAYISGLLDKIPSVLNFPTYLAELQDYALRRWTLQKAGRLSELGAATQLTPEQLKEEFAELYEASTKVGNTKPMIVSVTPAEARKYEPSETDFLIGEGIISRGNFITIGGEPGVGKSTLAFTLAGAISRGNGNWIGYKVRTRGRTYVLQSENDANRLKEECSALPADYDDWIKISSELTHGLAFDNPEFRRELRRIYDAWPFDVLILDPWNDISSEEGQKDYKEALLNIASVFRGARMPAVVIVAHLRKKRGDESNTRRKSGRELLHELSGSLALGSTSRTVFVMQHATNAMDDDRVIVEIAKANNANPEYLKQVGTRGAWRRGKGQFDPVKGFDWEEYDNPGDPERRRLSEDMILEILRDERNGLKPAALVKRLKEQFNIGASTAHRAISENGYLSHLLHRTGLGTLVLVNPPEAN